MPSVRSVIGRVSQRTGDTLWVAVTQATSTDASIVNYPAFGTGARLVPLRVDGSPTTVQLIAARPHFTEMMMTSGLVAIVVLFGLLIVALEDYT